MNQSKGLASH